MTRLFRTALAALMITSAPALAVDIFEADGAWIGEGQLSSGPEAGLERGRCKVSTKPNGDASNVSVTGFCAVAGGRSEISLKLVRSASGKINAGVWSAATGQTVQLAGRETGTTISLASRSPLSIEGKSYETQVDISAPNEASFAIRQLLRPVGDSAWRLVVDMTYARGN